MASILDVADAIVVHSSGRASMGTMALQKLCYLAQGMHLATRSEPLFSALLHAWASGPASPDLRSACADSYTIATCQLGVASRLAHSELLVVQEVASHFGSMNGNAMATMTREQLPWINARARATEEDPYPELRLEEMRMFFRAWLDAPGTPIEYANRFSDRYAELTEL